MSPELICELKNIPGSDLKHYFDTYLRFISCSARIYTVVDEVDEGERRPRREHRLIAEVTVGFETFGYRPDTHGDPVLGFLLVPVKEENGIKVPIRYIDAIYGELPLKCRGVQTVSIDASQRSGETIDHSSEVREVAFCWVSGQDLIGWKPC
jgi:hypothetical protein